MKKNLIAFILVISLALSVGSCGAQGENEGIEESNIIESAAITVVDMLGNEVTFDMPAERCVTVYYGVTYTMMALGLQEKLIGIESNAGSRPLYKYSAAELLSIESVGSLREFSPETAIALNPDVVFLNKRLLEYKDVLEAVGIKVIMINMETQSEFEYMIGLIAMVCGKPERADALISYYNAEFEKAAVLTDGLKDDGKPIVYIGAPSSYMSTSPEGMYQAELIAKAGGINAAKELEGNYWTEVSYEHILVMDPDIIFLPVEAGYTAEDVLNDAQLANIKAIKNRAVYHMPIGLDAWDSPGPSSILGLKYMLANLYPELYGMDEMRLDAEYFYDTFFGFTIDDSIIEIK